jgi:uridine monophosphate synthetase
VTTPFIPRLAARTAAADSLLCVGLDPHPGMLEVPTPAAARDFCLRLIEACAPVAAAFKPNSAFFEALGPEGMEALIEVIAAVPDEIPVILDAKRGDIASTAEAYAAAVFDVLGADALTVNPYLGHDAVAPFLARPERGAFVLVKTSNPGSNDLQSLETGAGPLYLEVAGRAPGWSAYDNVGLVVGATDPPALAAVRAAAPTLWFLTPGVGVQGGDLDAALAAGLREDGSGMLVTVSRSIAVAADPAAAATRLVDAIRDAAKRRPVPEPAAPRTTRVIAAALAEAECVRFGEFTLKSGATSPIYLDLRRLVSVPGALRQTAAEMVRLLAGIEFDRLAAIPYAALPIAVAASLEGGHPVIYPRREPKSYGTAAAIEGGFAAGDTVVVVDDLATTGGSKFETIEKLEAAGLVVRDVVVLIDREQGAAEAMAEAGYRLHAVTTMRALLAEWRRTGVVDQETSRAVEEYLDG